MIRVFILLESRDNKNENTITTTRDIRVFLNEVVNTIIRDNKQ